jgi:para-nitrobenzyl esterase
VESGPPYTTGVEPAAERTERIAAHLGVACTRTALAGVPAARLVTAAAEFAEMAGGSDAGLLMTPVVDGGLLLRPPLDAVAAGSASEVPLLIGTNRDESAFFALGSPKLMSLDDDGLRRWMRRATPDPASADAVIAAVRSARAERGESTEPRELWSAIATEFVFRVGSIRLADAHAAAAGPGVGTYCYLFTWESPAFDGVLGSCHALEIPFVFGTVKSPMVQGFSGAGGDAFALSAAIRRSWTSFARTGEPAGGTQGPGSSPWPQWHAEDRPTTVLGPWPNDTGLVRRVDGPRDAELSAVDAIAGDHLGHRGDGADRRSA